MPRTRRTAVWRRPGRSAAHTRAPCPGQDAHRSLEEVLYQLGDHDGARRRLEPNPNPNPNPNLEQPDSNPNVLSVPSLEPYP